MSALDLSQARRYLATLGQGENFTFQTFSDYDDLKVKRPDGEVIDPNAKIAYGTLAPDDDAGPLARMNAKGAGVYVMVSAGNGKGRTAQNVVRVRAVFVDTDGASYPNPLPLRPHIIVQSSPGRWHLYWLVTGLELDAFKPFQKGLAEHYGTDLSIHDLPRVMRIPGFYHHKNDPVMVQLLETSDHAPYSHGEIVGAWPLLAERLEEERVLEAERVKKRAAALKRAAEHKANPQAAKDDRGRAEKLLQAHHDTVASSAPGTRHGTLLRAARALGGYVATGGMEYHEAEDILKAAADVCGLPDGEAADAIGWGLKKGAEYPLELEDTPITNQITFLSSKSGFDELPSSSNESPWITQKRDLKKSTSSHIGSSWTNGKSAWDKPCR